MAFSGTGSFKVVSLNTLSHTKITSIPITLPCLHSQVINQVNIPTLVVISRVLLFQGVLLGKFLKQRKNLKVVETKKQDQNR